MKLTTRLGKKGFKVCQLLKASSTLTGPIKDWDGIVGSELFYGQAYGEEPGWKKFLESGIEEPIPELKNQGVAALLFVPVEKDSRYLIYMFGYGHAELIDGRTEWDFGVKVVLNTIKENAIRSLDTRSLGRKSKLKRVQLSGEGTIAEFDLDIMSDLVNRISGLSTDTDFAKGIIGGESLIMTADLESSSIKKKTLQIMKRYKLKDYQTHFKWIDFLSPVKDQLLVESLDQELVSEIDQAISSNDPGGILLSYPVIVDDDIIDHISYGGFSSHFEADWPDMGEFIAEYSKAGYTKISHDLSKLQVVLFDTNDKYQRHYTLYKCLSCEVEYNSDFYIFSNGIWFKLDKSYYTRVSKFYDALLLNTDEYDGGLQTFDPTETYYLKNFKQSGYEVTDQIFFKRAPTDIEFADIVSTKQEMIHVKGGTGSASLSHLFSQAFVSAKLMLNDVEFRGDFMAAIQDPAIKSVFRIDRFYPGEVTIVLRIVKRAKKLELPFISKITLFDIHQKIKAMGYKFRLDWVKVGI